MLWTRVSSVNATSCSSNIKQWLKNPNWKMLEGATAVDEHCFAFLGDFSGWRLFLRIWQIKRKYMIRNQMWGATKVVIWTWILIRLRLYRMLLYIFGNGSFFPVENTYRKYPAKEDGRNPAQDMSISAILWGTPCWWKTSCHQLLWQTSLLPIW